MNMIASFQFQSETDGIINLYSDFLNRNTPKFISEIFFKLMDYYIAKWANLNE